jgi:predicted ATP-grasp superfamily ATP-dependent carboligase
VLICGVSTRAAAESAARAGYSVTALDAFGDLDQHAAVRAISMPRDAGRRFTAAAAARAARDLDCEAVAYLSPFENHPRAVGRLARGRALWGNPPEVLRRVRDPRLLARALRIRGLPSLAIRSDDSNDSHDSKGWLLKPRRSGGGHRVRSWPRGAPVPRGSYLQERVTGTAGSVVFVAARGKVVPLAMSRQLIGEPAFGAAGYRYCGNIIAAAGDPQWDRGEALAEAAFCLARAAAEEFDLVGVNGIDFVARDGIPYLVEVNPRWSGSMEVVERAAGATLFGVHAAACATGVLPDPGLPRTRPGVAAGKAILFARADVIMGETHAWRDHGDLRDVPHPGERIRAGHPVCTVLATGRDAAACRDALLRGAEAVYNQLAEWVAPGGASCEG